MNESRDRATSHEGQRGHHQALVDFSKAPVVVFWETTRACALKCLHCRAQAQPYRHPLELDTAGGFRLLEDLASFEPKPIVVLTGGDAFMRRDIFELLAYGIEQGLRMSISPSVTRLVTTEVLERLRGMGISRISFSLDGSTAAVHDSFRGVRGSYDLTLRRIQDALDVGLSLQVHTTVTRHNLSDLGNVARLVSLFPKMALWDLFFLVPTGRGTRDDVISAQQHENVYQYLWSLEKSLPFAIKTTLGQPYRRVVIQNSVREGGDPTAAWASAARSAANDGKGICFVSHTGNIYPSGFLPVLCGNVRAQAVTDVYQSHPVFLQLRDPDLLKGKCGRCPFRTVCGGCRARAYAYTSDYLAPEPCCIYDPAGDGGPAPA